MRVVCFIFILQAVMLLTQPCDEIFPQLSEYASATEHSSLFEGSQPNDTDDDECSPFCSCSCCSHPVTNPTVPFGTIAESEYAAIRAALVEYSSPQTASFHGSIWQPPKA